MQMSYIGAHEGTYLANLVLVHMVSCESIENK